ncbi:MAG: dTDP-glucose 4,6-dehydratase [Firmicutes bacterium HGW-Firmicutes-12]|nr:MAG: dTDP-glucose 4,6-dehydratase [Firmicutes bacterium HGW-Firmicutes-12]
MEVYIVTGGAGFIGSHFIRHLMKKNKESLIINIDKLTYAGNLKNLEDIQAERNYVFIHEDISNAEAIKQIFAKFSPAYVVNFAAESHVDRSIADAVPFITTNIAGTQVLLQASLSCNIRKYVQISTDEVYGPLEPGAEPFKEDSSLKPSSPYAASKGAADLLVHSYNKTFGLPMNIIRSSNNYGTHQYSEKLIPLLIRNYRLGKPLPLYGDGTNTREWLHVKDYCRAIDMVLHEGRNGEVYNVGTGDERQNLEIAELLLALLMELSKEKRVLTKARAELIEFVEDRKGHDKRYASNWDKIKKELGWMPRLHFDEGLRETVEWYLERGLLKV